jgi:thiol peroxidase
MLNTKFKSLFSRAVIVLNSSGIVIYREQVKEIGDEPNYDAALKIIRDN